MLEQRALAAPLDAHRVVTGKRNGRVEGPVLARALVLADVREGGTELLPVDRERDDARVEIEAAPDNVALTQR